MSFTVFTVIRKSFFFRHFNQYPKFSKLMFFLMKRSSDLEKIEYIHDGVHYKTFSDLLKANPDKVPKEFRYMFHYPSSRTDELLFFKKA